MTANELSLTGKGDDPAWAKAPLLTDFRYPWENKQAPPTRFQALHSGEWLYCFFDVTDPAVHIPTNTGDKMDVVNSSRAEIFFKANDAMNPYYCLELDPSPRVLDYQGFYHRNFDFTWCWPAGHLQIKSHQRLDGYSIEVAISKRSLRELGLLNSDVLQAGLYRADCTPRPGKEPDFKWISWVMPDSETPDFHIPSSFGLLKLVD